MTLADPPALSGTISVTSNFNGQDVSCFGSSDGEATVTPTGGTPPYSFSWDANATNQTDSIATGLTAGSYDVTVADANGCDSVFTITLSEPPLLTAAIAITSNFNGQDVSCFGAGPSE